MMKSDKKVLLAWIEKEAASRIREKFTKGDREHHDDLMQIDLLHEAIDEAIDLVIYLYSLRARQLGAGVRLTSDILAGLTIDWTSAKARYAAPYLILPATKIPGKKTRNKRPASR